MIQMAQMIEKADLRELTSGGPSLRPIGAPCRRPEGSVITPSLPLFSSRNF